MALIHWSEEFITGIDSIDDQHHRLVDLINKFEEAGRRGRSPRVISEILNQLVGYTQEHFAHEEKLMADSGFPGAREHMDRHRRLLQNVEQFQFEYENEGRQVTPDVLEFLHRWVSAHLLTEDMAYAAHLRRTPVGV